MNSLSSTTEEVLRLDARGWMKVLSDYRTPNNIRAWFEVAITFAPFCAVWVLMYLSLSLSYFLTAALMIPAALLLVRIFIIQHDCGHGSFMESRSANDWLGRLLGVLTLTPYFYWQRNHAIHHAGSGSLDHRGIGDITTLTVEEYRERTSMRQFLYRLYRNPVTLFVVGPAYVFLLEQRLPIGMMTMGWKPWLSTMYTNIGIGIAAFSIIYWVGWLPFLMIQFPVTILAASIGVWLFFVQHQYEDTVWERRPEWDRREAALHGSSHYDLPPVLRWFSGNIGIHHVHHLCSHIPFYRLTDVIRDFPELKDISRITLFESLRCARLALWDSKSYKLLSFREAQSVPA